MATNNSKPPVRQTQSRRGPPTTGFVQAISSGVEFRKLSADKKIYVTHPKFGEQSVELKRAERPVLKRRPAPEVDVTAVVKRALVTDKTILDYLAK